MDGELYYWPEIADRTCIWSSSPTFLIMIFSNSPSHPPPPSPFLIVPGNRHDVGAKHWNISNNWRGKGAHLNPTFQLFTFYFILFYFTSGWVCAPFTFFFFLKVLFFVVVCMSFRL